MNLKNTFRKAEKALRPPGPLSARTASDDPKAGKSLTVSGPYPNRQKFGLIVTDETGKQSKIYDTRAEAEAVKAQLLNHARTLRELTIGESIGAYSAYRLSHKGVKAATADDHDRQLRDFLSAGLADRISDGRAGPLSLPRICQAPE